MTCTLLVATTGCKHTFTSKEVLDGITVYKTCNQTCALKQEEYITQLQECLQTPVPGPTPEFCRHRFPDGSPEQAECMGTAALNRYKHDSACKAKFEGLKLAAKKCQENCDNLIDHKFSTNP